jgi:hypothetical protein
MPANRDDGPATGRLRPPGLALLLAEARGIFELNTSLLLHLVTGTHYAESLKYVASS